MGSITADFEHSTSDELRAILKPRNTQGPQQFSWTGLCADSRVLEAGQVFFAIPGAKHDGLRFIADAVAAGAAAVVVPEAHFEAALAEVGELPLIAVSDIRRGLAEAAAFAAGYPSRGMRCVAITGTNGKTSTAWLSAQLLRSLGHPTLLCGTLGIAVLQPGTSSIEWRKTDNTTPDPLRIQAELREALRAEVRYAIFEATSQGIAQERLRGIDWDTAVFTNLTRDHLDIHESFEVYKGHKFSLFSDLLYHGHVSTRSSLCNIDDPAGRELLGLVRDASWSEQSFAMSARDKADYFAKGVECTLEGIRASLCTPASDAGGEACVEVQSGLLGRYNIDNLLSAFAIVHRLGFAPVEIAEALEQVPAVPGRLERVGEGDPFVFVDYAHTPDALRSVLESIREISKARLVCIFGCGGDRDPGKRPLMAETVAALADVAIVTSDNPRTEEPERIIADTVRGFDKAASSCEWRAVVDRRQAITETITQAHPGDVIVVAGKGHEDYQEIHGIKHPFLDSEVCAAALDSLRLRKQ